MWCEQGRQVVPVHDVMAVVVVFVVACTCMFVNEVSIKGGRLGTAGVFNSLPLSITIIPLVVVVPFIIALPPALSGCVWGHGHLWLVPSPHKVRGGA
jgi:hypothetical protein